MYMYTLVQSIRSLTHPLLVRVGGSGGAVLLLPSSNPTDLDLLQESPNAIEARLLSRFFKGIVA